MFGIYKTWWLRCTSVIVVLSLTSLLRPLALQAAKLPPHTQRALLAGEWEQVFDSLKDVELDKAEAPCRLVAAQACLATNRNNRALLLLLSVKNDGLDEWRAWTKQLADAHPSNAVACYLHGDALTRAGDMGTAEGYFSKAIDRNPKFGLAWVGRGILRAITGRDDEAYVDLFQATQVQPDLAEAHASLGCAEITFRNASGALDAFNDALKRNPTFALAYNGRGCAHYGLGRPDEAAQDFDAAQDLFPALAATTALNHTFVLAMVANKVDENMGVRSRPGTTLQTRSQRLVVDIPGVRTQGAGRPESWGPHLMSGESYARFNIRHEGNLPALQKPEPGLTITLPAKATPEEISSRLQPVFNALKNNKHVYAKIDMNLLYSSYTTHGKPQEFQWARSVGDTINDYARSVNPKVKSYLNTHSAGTVAAEKMNLSQYHGVIVESYRGDANDLAKLARQHPNTRFVWPTGDRDLPHGLVGGAMGIDEPNVTSINLKTGSPSPFRVHSQVADANTAGTFQIKDASGTRHVSGTLGSLVSDSLGLKSDIGTIAEMINKPGADLDQVSRIIRTQQRDLLTQISEANKSVQAHNRAVQRWGNAVVATEAAKWAVTAATLRGDIAARELGKGALRVGVEGAKSLASAGADHLPKGADSLARTTIGGIGIDKAFDPVGAVAQGFQEWGSHVQQRHLGMMGDINKQSINNLHKMQQLDRLGDQVIAMKVMRDIRGEQPKGQLTDQQIRNALMVSSMPWKQMPKLFNDVQRMTKEGASVAVIGQTMQAHALMQMLDNKNTPTLNLPSADRGKLAALNRQLPSSAIVGFKPGWNDTDRYKVPLPFDPPQRNWNLIGPDPALTRKFPGGPPPPGGGGGALLGSDAVGGPKWTRDLVAWSLIQNVTRQVPPGGPGGGGAGVGSDPLSGFTGKASPPGFGSGGTGVPRLDAIRAASQSKAAWDWGKPWAPKGDAGGVDTNMDWVFVDKGDWPVTTFFSLVYEAPTVEPEVSEDRNSKGEGR